jgi:hypothetical protein
MELPTSGLRSGARDRLEGKANDQLESLKPGGISPPGPPRKEKGTASSAGASNRAARAGSGQSSLQTLTDPEAPSIRCSVSAEEAIPPSPTPSCTTRASYGLPK